MPKKKSKKAEGLTPQQIQQMNRDNINYQMSVLPPLEFDDMYANSQTMMGGLLGNALPLFGAIMGRGEQTMANNPMMPLFEMLGISAGGQPSQPLPPPDFTPQVPEPQLSPYEQRIQELMTKRGWSRQEAIANQQNALGLKTDYDNDGAVSNDEWAKFEQTPYGMAYSRQHSPKYQQPQAPVGAGVPNLTPEQIAALQKFQGYRGGMR
jgi:hypothetical protein